MANIYFAELPSFVKLSVVNPDEFDVFHIFGVCSPRRNDLKEFLLAHNVKTEIHYPIPPNKQRAMQGALSVQYPIAQERHATELSLPISYWHNLQDLFDIGKEVWTYSRKEEALELVGYYLDHPSESKEIAQAVKVRTLSDHMYSRRMQELVPILRKYLCK